MGRWQENHGGQLTTYKFCCFLFWGSWKPGQLGSRTTLLGLVSEETWEQSQHHSQSKPDVPQNIILHSALGSSTSTQPRGATSAESHLWSWGKLSLWVSPLWEWSVRGFLLFLHPRRFSYKKSVPSACHTALCGTFTPIPRRMGPHTLTVKPGLLARSHHGSLSRHCTWISFP